MPLPSARTARGILVAANAREAGVPNAHRVRPGFVLLMGAAGDAHFQDATRVPVTSISVQLMGVVNVAKRKVVTSLQWEDPHSARDTVGESDARSQDATSQHSRQRNFVLSTEEGKSANNMDVRRLLGVELCIVLRMVVAFDVSWRDATVFPSERHSYAEHMVAAPPPVSTLLLFNFEAFVLACIVSQEDLP